MSANKIIFTSNNTLSAVGNYRIISYSDSFQNVQAVLGVEDSISGLSSGINLQRSFRWSRDGQSWSLWIDFTETIQTALTSLAVDPKDELYMEFRYMVIDDPNASPSIANGTEISPEVVINSFDLLLDIKAVDGFANYLPTTLCSDQFGIIPVLLQSNFNFNPYAVNKGINLYNELSQMVNLTFGHDVSYFRVMPQVRSKDIVFKEWTLYNVQQEKCLKILVPNNEFPDAKPQYNQFGLDFEIPFEVHIVRKYWEQVYGKNTMPQKFDIIYFPLINRIYEVQSTYSYRDFMQQPVYFKVQLIKYQPRANVLDGGTDALQKLDDITISTEELFGEEMKQEIEKHTKPQQYVTITHQEDPIRSRVNRNIPVVRYNFYNNWTLVGEHYYNLKELHALQGTVEAVSYRANGVLGAKDSRAFTCWFSPDTGGANSIRPLISAKNSLGIGYAIDLSFSTAAGASSILYHLNGTTYSFPLTGVTLAKDQWYAIVVNISNEFAQASVDLWVMQPNTTELKNIYHKVLPVTPVAVDSGEEIKLVASPLYITNIRLFDRMLEEEHQSLVLNQLVVKDSDKAIVIDNAKPLLRLARVTNPK